MRAALTARRPGRLGAGVVALICGLALLAGSATAEILTLTRDQAVAVARRAWLSGDAVLAYAIVSKIVAADPLDVEALLLLSASTEALGHPGAAFTLGRRAWSAAQVVGRPQALRYEIALQTAHAALTAGQKRSAAHWLGRAVEVAPTPAARSQSEGDLRQVKSRIPLSFSGSLRVSPTDNLNNGAVSGRWTVEDYYLGQLAGWSVAHGGVLTSAQVTATYNLGVTPSGRARNALGFGLSTTLHSLSASEAAANPDLDPTELDSWRAALKWTQDRLMDDRPPLRISLEASQSWFGGVAYSPALRAEVAVPLTQTGDLTLEAVLERQWPQTPITAASLHLDGHRQVTLPWGDGTLIYGLGATFLRSSAPNSTYDSLDASLILDPKLPLDKVSSHVGIGVTWRHNDDWLLGIGNIHASRGRTDHGVWLRAGLGFEQVKLAGMTPTLTLQRQMNWSDISKYQTAATTVYLGLAADF